MSVICHRTPMAVLSRNGGEEVMQFPFSTMSNLCMLQRAVVLAQRVHLQQRRVDGSSYITHPLAVMHILMETSHKLPLDTYIAAVLHDVLECDERYSAVIESRFGLQVHSMVRALTKTYVAHETHEEKEKRYVKQLVKLSRTHPHILLIKLADRLHNLETAEALPKERLSRLIQETECLYLPVFRRGLASGPPETMQIFSSLFERLCHSLTRQSALCSLKK